MLGLGYVLIPKNLGIPKSDWGKNPQKMMVLGIDNKNDGLNVGGISGIIFQASFHVP